MMNRLRLSLVSSVCVGAGGVLGILYERKKVKSAKIGNFLPALHAVDVEDGKNFSKEKPPYFSSSSMSHKETPEQYARRNEIMRFGYPGYENLKYRDDYVLSYNRRLRLPNWVCEHLTVERLRKHVADRSKCDFTIDTSVHPMFRVTNEDYRKSGYDRGHMAAAANHRYSQDANCQTFLLSNIGPQVGSGFNRDSWEHLEKYVRHLPRSYKNVYVLTGPLFLPKLEQDGHLYVKYKLIGQHRIAVPTHYFKVVLTESHNNKYELQSYILPNQPINEKTPLHRFQVPVETIEKASGLVMFEKLPRKYITEVQPQFN